ncbi:unnamed protein product [Linum trigynum]|uniref:Uncharacterized protein n=1 Tax=Linum trigynum TaxID=586398 RepID=A0AAV2CT22_9ROSI
MGGDWSLSMTEKVERRDKAVVSGVTGCSLGLVEEVEVRNSMLRGELQPEERVGAYAKERRCGDMTMEEVG